MCDGIGPCSHSIGGCWISRRLVRHLETYSYELWIKIKWFCSALVVIVMSSEDGIEDDGLASSHLSAYRIKQQYPILIQMIHRPTHKRFSSAIHLQLRLNTNRILKTFSQQKILYVKAKENFLSVLLYFFFFVFGFSFFYFSSIFILIFVLFRWKIDRNNGYCNKLCARQERCDGKGKGVDMSARNEMNLRKNLAKPAMEMECWQGKRIAKIENFFYSDDNTRTSFVLWETFVCLFEFLFLSLSMAVSFSCWLSALLNHRIPVSGYHVGITIRIRIKISITFAAGGESLGFRSDTYSNSIWMAWMRYDRGDKIMRGIVREKI